MANYPLTQSGDEVQALLDKVQSPDSTPTTGSQNLVTSEGVKAVLDQKVDKVSGKGLSTNDYTDAEKQKLGALPTNADLQTSLAGKAAKSDVDAIKEKIPSSASSSNKMATQADIADFITRTVSDLVNYYTKSETYTKQEVANLIGAIHQFHYEIYATIPATGDGSVLYLIGPTGTGSDKYEEYVWANNDFVKIGDTSIDLSGYSTTEQMNAAINAALANYTTTEALEELLAQKANKDGYYGGMTVGSAENLVGKHQISGEITMSVMSGADGIAKINEVRGKSLVWNQLITSGVQGTTTENGVTIVSNGDGSYTVSTVSTGATATTVVKQCNPQWIKGHKYLIKG